MTCVMLWWATLARGSSDWSRSFPRAGHPVVLLWWIVPKKKAANGQRLDEMISGYYWECAKSNFPSATHHLLLIKYSLSLIKFVVSEEEEKKPAKTFPSAEPFVLVCDFLSWRNCLPSLPLQSSVFLTLLLLWRYWSAVACKGLAIALQRSSIIYQVYDNTIGNRVLPIAQAMITRAKEPRQLKMIFIFCVRAFYTVEHFTVWVWICDNTALDAIKERKQTRPVPVLCSLNWCKISIRYTRVGMNCRVTSPLLCLYA